MTHALLAMVLSVAAPAAPSGNVDHPLWGNPVSSTPETLWDIAVADVTGDGIPDVVAVRWTLDADDLAVHAGLGNGLFAAPYVLESGGRESHSLVVTDLNGDDRPDLAVVSADPDRLWVRLATADGGFAPPAGVTSGLDPWELVAADLDGDGDVDLACANSGSDDATVFFNDGRGGFDATVTVAIGPAPRGIAVADVDDDGLGDLLVTSSEDVGLVLARQTSVGRFAEVETFVTPNQPWRLDTGDIDNDGDEDAVVVEVPGRLAVLENDGRGCFEVTASLALPSGGIGVVLTDVDADGWLDACAISFYADVLSVFIGSPAGFRPATPYEVGAGATAIVAADLNTDGARDLAVAVYQLGSGPDAVYVLPNDGTGHFHTDVYQGPDSGRASHLVSADFDADGDADLMLAIEEGRPALLRNAGDGAFAAAETIRPETPSGDSDWLTAGDLDGDGRADLVAKRAVYLNLGEALFGPPIPIDTGPGPGLPSLGDLDGDGDLDLAVTDWDADTVRVLANVGGGRFVPWLEFTSRSTQVAMADLDGDGDLDLATAELPDGITIRDNLGDGLFATAISFAPETRPDVITSGDLDHDGDVDLVVGDFLRGVWVARNDGAGRFEVTPLPGFDLQTNDLTLADFSGDGWPDLAIGVVAGETAVVHVALNDGTGVLGEPVAYGVGRGLGFLAAADYDADGRSDLALAASLGGYWNGGGLSLLLTANPPRCRADLDGDGGVGFGDLLMILERWGSYCSGCRLDLNRDDRIDATDLLTVLDRWGRCGG